MKGLVLLMDTNLPLKDPVPIFALVLFIILLAPIILRKFRIPSIIGLIIAGMLIGDNGLKIIEKGSIDLFAKAGLLYIMFLAGLELDMTEFRKNRYRSMVFGAFTFFIPLTMGYLVCTYVLHAYAGSLSAGQQAGHYQKRSSNSSRGRHYHYGYSRISDTGYHYRRAGGQSQYLLLGTPGHFPVGFCGYHPVADAHAGQVVLQENKG
jgi:hypothetical protein